MLEIINLPAESYFGITLNLGKLKFFYVHTSSTFRISSYGLIQGSLTLIIR